MRRWRDEARKLQGDKEDLKEMDGNYQSLFISNE